MYGCINKLCTNWSYDFRKHCSKVTKIDVKCCQARKDALKISRKNAVIKCRKKKRAWWNGYQKSYFHPQYLKPVSVVAVPFGNMIQVKNCPFCHGRHIHVKGRSLKFAQCCGGYYKIKIKRG